MISERDYKIYGVMLVSKRFCKYMNKHLGGFGWITPYWASQHYGDYCRSGIRRSATLDPRYRQMVDAMEAQMDKMAGMQPWEIDVWLDPHADMRNPNRCGTFIKNKGHILDKLREQRG